MYLLIACGASWLALIGALVTTSSVIGAPRSISDLLILVIVGASVLGFARIGVVSLLTLFWRVLPGSRPRVLLTQFLLRIVPTVLRSTVVAALSTGLLVQSAQAAPVADFPDPAWPTTEVDAPENPAWPTSPGASPQDPATDRPRATPRFHTVVAGDSLWSIAVDSHPSANDIASVVDEIYTQNRKVIGADANLILPGQRLEIRP